MSCNHYTGLPPYLISQMRYHARRLHRHPAVCSMDVEDIEQELILAFLLRQDTYEASKASWPTFIDRVLTYHGYHLIEKAKAQKRHVNTVSLDAYCEQHSDSDIGELCDVIANTAIDELQIDVERITNVLPPHLAILLINLQTHSVREIAQATKIPRSTLYDTLLRLRAALIRHGFKQSI